MMKRAYLAFAATLLVLSARSGSGDNTMETTASGNAAATNAVAKTETALLGSGCFWCTEAVFQRVPGVKSVKSGYAGGTTKKPTYQDVCTGTTGHAEVLKIEFDPKQVSYSHLLDVFWSSHDPTTLNRQGADVGTQYRSVIFYYSPEQKAAAEASKKKEDASGKHKNPIVTQIVPATDFYEAEGYHQEYFNRNKGAPYCRFVIAPKLKKLGMGE